MSHKVILDNALSKWEVRFAPQPEVSMILLADISSLGEESFFRVKLLLIK